DHRRLGGIRRPVRRQGRARRGRAARGRGGMSRGRSEAHLDRHVGQRIAANILVDVGTIYKNIVGSPCVPTGLWRYGKRAISGLVGPLHIGYGTCDTYLLEPDLIGVLGILTEDSLRELYAYRLVVAG